MIGLELKIEGKTVGALQEDGVLTWNNMIVDTKLMMLLFGSNGIETNIWYDNESTDDVRTYEISVVEISQVSRPIRTNNKKTEKLLEEYYSMEKELKERGIL